MTASEKKLAEKATLYRLSDVVCWPKHQQRLQSTSSSQRQWHWQQQLPCSKQMGVSATALVHFGAEEAWVRGYNQSAVYCSMRNREKQI